MGTPSHPHAIERAAALATEVRAILGKIRRRLREHGGRHELTPSQVSVILRLEKAGPATVSNLARAEGMRPQSMSAIVAALQTAKLVGGKSDPGDGRQTLVSLTKACQTLLKEGRAAKQDWLTVRIQQKLSPSEQKALAAALILLTRLVED